MDLQTQPCEGGVQAGKIGVSYKCDASLQSITRRLENAETPSTLQYQCFRLDSPSKTSYFHLHRADLQTLTQFFMWCVVINGGLLIFWTMLMITMPEMVYRTQSKWFFTPKRKGNERTATRVAGCASVIQICRQRDQAMRRFAFLTFLFGTLVPAPAVGENTQIFTRGLIVDLDADRGLELEDGDRVVKWTNQVITFSAKDFVKQDEGRREPTSIRW